MSNKFDVVIVGGGVIGLASAYEFSKRGLSVCVCERSSLGYGASHKSIGILMPQSPLTVDSLKILQWTSIGLFKNWIDGLENLTNVKCHYRQSGHLEIIAEKRSLKRVERQIAALSAWTRYTVIGGIRLLQSSEAKSIIPDIGDSEWGYYFCEATAQVSVVSLIRALANGIRMNGGIIRENCEVKCVESFGETSNISTSLGKLTSRWALLCCGAWMSQLSCLGFEVPDVVPVKGQVLQFARPPGQFVLNQPIVKREKIYIVDQGEQEWLVGSTTEHESGFDDTPTDLAKEFLRNGVNTLRSGMKDLSVIRHWAGLRPMCLDRRPIIGKLSDSILIAGGHFKIGVGTAPLTSIILGNIIQDIPIDRPMEAFDPLRFKAA